MAIAAQSNTPLQRRATYRHTIPVRISHWVNVVALFILLLSGFQIFNAHPSLYWGERSDKGSAVFSMGVSTLPSGEQRGMTSIAGRSFDTTGVFGLSSNAQGDLEARGFPSWATIPGSRWLSMGRRWHLFFAWFFVINGFLYVLYSLISRHLSRDLLPHKTEWRGIGRSIIDHLLFRHPQGIEAARYNILQKLAYVIVILGLGPLAVLTGLSMSPWFDSLVPITDLFGGRQSARTFHFIAAFAFVAFVLVHVFMVVITGVWNNLRSMITGRYDVVEKL